MAAACSIARADAAVFAQGPGEALDKTASTKS
jgi:hypothetical protein